MDTNIIYCGDNLKRLSELPEKSVDLIYADPPFFSNRHYEIIWNDGAELRAFEDRWKGGINNYVKWMRLRLAECHRVLKDTGSMYLHCDWHANARLRVLMDTIFMGINFQNEIIWKRYASGSKRAKGFNAITDTLYLYTKGKQFTFNHIYNPINPRKFNRKEYETGRMFKLAPLVKSGYTNHVLKFGDKTITLPENKRFVWSQSTVDNALKENPLCFYWSKENIPYQKLYKDEANGTPIDNLWLGIEGLRSNDREKIGYPTQKPEALLKRIIESSSNKGDIVLDPFCGCGTTIAVAQQLGRKWIGIDVSPTACRMMGERLNKLGAEVTINGMPETIEHLKSLEAFNFQDWVVNRIRGTHSNRRTGDMGIDGWTFLKHEPIQVKQSANVGRNVIDNFETAIRRANHTSGEIYAFSFAKGAYEEVARAENQDGLCIKLITIDELLDGATVKAVEKQSVMIK